MKNPIKKISEVVRDFLTIDKEIVFVKNILIDDYIRKNLFDNPKYSDTRRLARYEYQIYSQYGEDGIIQEIFNRIGATNKFFVEFGVENGLESNTTFLLLKGWKGCWLDGGKGNVRGIREKFGFLIDKKILAVKESFINAENIEGLFNSLAIPKEFDLLSIDIDGNDYWVWKALGSYTPRVVIIEYNSMFAPNTKWVMGYNPENRWNGSSYFGSSLKSLEILGSNKGYKLVGCNFTGVNAFFVRKDLVGDKFSEPFTAENHYEPPRYYLKTKIGHKRDFGAFEGTV